MTIQDIPLNQLAHSPLNVRKTRNKDRVAQFASSIEAHGILQNFRVHPAEGDKFGVVIGGTRLDALRLLLKQKKIAADYLVPCDVRPADDPTLTEASLAENIIRDAMHPADEFDAFKKLADDGQGPDTIAARFGTSPTMVRQRLKLAVVSPRLIAVFRKDEMTLDQLMAFTLTDEHRKQEKVWRELPEWSKRRGEAEPIRARLCCSAFSSGNFLVQISAESARGRALSHGTKCRSASLYLMPNQSNYFGCGLCESGRLGTTC